MPTPIEKKTAPAGAGALPARRGRLGAVLLAGLILPPALAGCGGEPSRREVKNARAFEALLTAVSIKNKAELEKDAGEIEQRHDQGELSNANHEVLREIVEKARSGNWSDAERRAYEFRKQFGDRGAYFD